MAENIIDISTFRKRSNIIYKYFLNLCEDFKRKCSMFYQQYYSKGKERIFVEIYKDFYNRLQYIIERYFIRDGIYEIYIEKTMKKNKFKVICDKFLNRLSSLLYFQNKDEIRNMINILNEYGFEEIFYKLKNGSENILL